MWTAMKSPRPSTSTRATSGRGGEPQQKHEHDGPLRAAALPGGPSRRHEADDGAIEPHLADRRPDHHHAEHEEVRAQLAVSENASEDRVQDQGDDRPDRHGQEHRCRAAHEAAAHSPARRRGGQPDGAGLGRRHRPARGAGRGAPAGTLEPPLSHISRGYMRSGPASPSGGPLAGATAWACRSACRCRRSGRPRSRTASRPRSRSASGRSRPSRGCRRRRCWAR